MEQERESMHLNENRILYYHVIADNLPDIYPQGISLPGFIRQMNWLKRSGWSFTKLSDVVSGATKSTKNTSITLDDGLACCFPALMHMIKNLNIKPTLFLIGKCLDNRALAWNHKLILLRRYVPMAKLERCIAEVLPRADSQNLFSRVAMAEKDELTDQLWKALMPFSQKDYLMRNKPFLSKEQMRELVSKGAELALHSFSHPDFSRVNYEEAKMELVSNCQALEELDLQYFKLFAYPYGLAGDESREIKLNQDLGISAFFGVRYSVGYNQPGKLKWQRQNMEQNQLKNTLEFICKPQLRYLKSLLNKRSK